MIILHSRNDFENIIEKVVAIFYVCPSASEITLKDINGGLAQYCSNSLAKALELTAILQ